MIYKSMVQDLIESFKYVNILCFKLHVCIHKLGDYQFKVFLRHQIVKT